MSRFVRGAVAACAAALVGAAGFAAPAAAHVTVDPQDAAQGGYARVAFRMPNERDNANTVKLEVHMPEDHPIASVLTTPVPGWNVKIAMRKLDEPLDLHGRKIEEVVGTITWTASKGAEVKPNEFQEFPVSLGPLPEVDQLVFKTIQTYDNDEVVRWIEEHTEGDEPEHPAPVLRLVPPPAENGAPDDAGDEQPAAKEHPATPAETGAPMWLAVAGLVAGLAGLALGAAALLRGRGRRPAAAGYDAGE
ncbi:MAG: DUF1775 domain-containing protein [Micromonosporaceae bacterium]|nr:DUF1775 domain-containing protein [Micromonosporaceae bacterium]